MALSTALPAVKSASRELIAGLRLIRTPNVGAVTYHQLIARFGSAEEALHHLPDLARRGGAKQFEPCTQTQAEKEIAAAEKFGARLLLYTDADYPALLKHTEGAPPVITALGDAQLWQKQDCIAMVGARNASGNGCVFAGKLARELGVKGFTIVSGLARGIDTHAHKASVASGTVAVIAGGIDHIYPPENAKLYDEIRERGAIISEQPFGQLPFASSFPARNRIISGMSRACVVVEASPKSGSLITARLAAEQGREVFAVPGHPADPRAQGCNRLIKQGAMLLESANDVMEALAQTRLRVEESPKNPYLAAPLAEVLETESMAARAKLLEILGPSPLWVDDLLDLAGLTPGLLYTALIELELAGRITRHAGNRISLKIQDT